MLHMCVGEQRSVAAGNGLLHDRRQAIIETNADLLSIGWPDNSLKL